MTQSIDLDHQLHIDASHFPHLDDAVKDRLPMRVASKIVVRYEKSCDPSAVIVPDNVLDSVR